MLFPVGIVFGKELGFVFHDGKEKSGPLVFQLWYSWPLRFQTEVGGWGPYLLWALFDVGMEGGGWVLLLPRCLERLVLPRLARFAWYFLSGVEVLGCFCCGGGRCWLLAFVGAGIGKICGVVELGEAGGLSRSVEGGIVGGMLGFAAEICSG